MTAKQSFKALCLAFAFGTAQQAMSQDSYFVSTESGVVTSEQEQDPNAGKSAEQRFLNENFPYRSLCDWTDGMRFMVIPGDRDTYLNIFIDAGTNKEIATGTLKHKILVYRGYEITDRGWIHLNFEVQDDSKRRIYHEVRNLSFSDYCQKIAGGGVPSLAYLDEVDKAKEVLVGKTLYTLTEIFYKDDSSSRNGYREYPLSVDTKLTVTGVGVGTREFPVKIVCQDEQGRKYFQLCTLSHTNCGLNDNDFIAKNENHLFDQSFSFTQKFADEHARTKADPTKDFSALPKTGPTSPTNTRYMSFAGLVTGTVDKGATKELTRLSKGEPDKKWTNKDGTVTWWYADGTELTFSKKGIVTKVGTSSGRH